MPESVEAECRKCSRTVKLAVTDLVNGNRLRCPACGAEHELKFEGGRDYNKILGQTKKQVDEMVKQLSRSLRRR